METILDVLKRKYPQYPWDQDGGVWNYIVISPMSLMDDAQVLVKVWFNKGDKSITFHLPL